MRNRVIHVPLARGSDRHHRLLITGRGGLGVLDHGRKEVSRSLLLKSFGGDLCPCLQKYHHYLEYAARGSHLRYHPELFDQVYYNPHRETFRDFKILKRLHARRLRLEGDGHPSKAYDGLLFNELTRRGHPTRRVDRNTHFRIAGGPELRLQVYQTERSRLDQNPGQTWVINACLASDAHPIGWLEVRFLASGEALEHAHEVRWGADMAELFAFKAMRESAEAQEGWRRHYFQWRKGRKHLLQLADLRETLAIRYGPGGRDLPFEGSVGGLFPSAWTSRPLSEKQEEYIYGKVEDYQATRGRPPGARTNP